MGNYVYFKGASKYVSDFEVPLKSVKIFGCEGWSDKFQCSGRLSGVKHVSDRLSLPQAA